MHFDGTDSKITSVTPHEVEVSWESLRQIVREWAGNDAELQEVAPLAGGAINTTLCLATNRGKVVLKITPHRVDRSYSDEAHQLKLLRQIGVPVPQVYLCKTGTLESPFSYLLIEFVEGVDLAAAREACSPEQFDQLQTNLAELVLLMHQQQSSHYQRIGATEQKQYDSWPSCYREIFDPIWRDVEKSAALPIKARKTISKVHQRLDGLLTHDDCPRLVHWDLWSTNVLARADEQGRWRVAALLDPNCKYAHSEAEIAYLELFHTITPAFLRAYQQSQRLSPEYHRLRRWIYQLYSLLNHLQLFGQEYLRPLIAMIDKVGALI